VIDCFYKKQEQSIALFFCDNIHSYVHIDRNESVEKRR